MVNELGCIASFNPDIVIETETWLSSSIFSSKLLPSNYTVYWKDKNNHSEGVLIADKISLSCHQIIIDNPCEIVACKIKLCTTPLIICAAYRPPNTDIDYLNSLYTALELICQLPSGLQEI